jgi:glycosyltransferase involved in cell wall biosynthesis
VIPYPPVGGGHKRTLRLLEAMGRAGVEPHLVVPGEPRGGARDALRARGAVLECVQQTPPTLRRRLRQHARRLPAAYDPAVGNRVEELAIRQQPSFIQIEHTQNACYRKAAPGLRSVLSLHNVDSESIDGLSHDARRGSLAWLRLRNRWRSMRATERRAARQADVLLCVSDQDAAAFTDLANRTIVVPNGVDEELFEIDDELPGHDQVLFFGLFDYEPNVLGVARFLRNGWPVVRRARPDARLRLAGGGMPSWLDAEANAAEGVDVLGFVERLDLELAASDAVVVPIWHGGGTRLKVLEAMAAARPVASTPLGVSETGFEHGRHGLVAETPAAVARAVVALLEDRPAARKLGGEARRLAERYAWQLVTRPAEELYAEWIERDQELMKGRAK